VNDPIKTMSTAMFIIQSVSSIMIDDLTRPEVQDGRPSSPSDEMIMTGEDGEDIKLTRAQEDDVVRTASAGFTDWTVSFFTQVLLLFEALPEPGKGSRNGGKMEDTMTQTLIVS
jgi:proteasome activator subunit 4